MLAVGRFGIEVKYAGGKWPYPQRNNGVGYFFFFFAAFFVAKSLTSFRGINAKRC
jgi:hypothetical protein